MSSKTKHTELSIATGKGMIRTGRDGLAFLSNSVGTIASNFLKKFSNPVVASKSYRYLARQIHQDLDRISGGKFIVFSSATTMEANANLLLMFAHFLQDELSGTILIIDGTFRTTGVTSLLQFAGEAGIADMFAADKEPLAAAGVTLPIKRNISIIPAGNVEAHPMPYITEEQVDAFISPFREQYDFVILQQDNIQLDTRYLPFAKSADLVLLHLEERSTPIAEFDKIKEVFTDHKIKNVKYILSEP